MHSSSKNKKKYITQPDNFSIRHSGMLRSIVNTCRSHQHITLPFKQFEDEKVRYMCKCSYNIIRLPRIRISHRPCSLTQARTYDHPCARRTPLPHCHMRQLFQSYLELCVIHRQARGRYYIRHRVVCWQ